MITQRHQNTAPIPRYIDGSVKNGVRNKIPPTLVKSHDKGHLSGFGKRATGLKISPEEFFQEFRNWQGKFDARVQINIQVLWFWVFHEVDVDSATATYSPRFIKEQLPPNDHTWLKRLQTRISPGDIGDEYKDSQYPTDSELKDAAESLREFAHLIEQRFGFPPRSQ